MNVTGKPAVWFLAIRAGTGADVFTQRLAEGLAKRGIRTEITWLPLRAEYAPWTVPIPRPPGWANVVHVGTWVHPRFLPRHLHVVATLHHAVHRSELEPYKGGLRSLYHRFWTLSVERRILRRADAVVAVSEFVAEVARENLVNRPMRVIYNGIDTKRFLPPVKRISHRPFRLLFVGKWAPLKGVDMLAPVMRELGAGYELSYTGDAAAERDKPDMPGNMRNIGRLRGDDAVIAAMQEADALLFPSRSEGFGLVAAEAMACGVPVLATRGSSLVEVVQDGVTGILCPRDDVMAFVTAARKLSTDPGFAIAMSEAARSAAVKHFSIDVMVEAYAALYAGLSPAGAAGSA